MIAMLPRSDCQPSGSGNTECIHASMQAGCGTVRQDCCPVVTTHRRQLQTVQSLLQIPCSDVVHSSSFYSFSLKCEIWFPDCSLLPCILCPQGLCRPGCTASRPSCSTCWLLQVSQHLHAMIRSMTFAHVEPQEPKPLPPPGLATHLGARKIGIGSNQSNPDRVPDGVTQRLFPLLSSCYASIQAVLASAPHVHAGVHTSTQVPPVTIKTMKSF
jgi:hypothetical protein